MNYRQWKKSYKKIHRIDFADVAARMAEAIVQAAADCMRIFGDMFNSAGMTLRNAAENMHGSVDSGQLRHEIIKEWKGEADGRNHD